MLLERQGIEVRIVQLEGFAAFQDLLEFGYDGMILANFGSLAGDIDAFLGANFLPGGPANYSRINDSVLAGMCEGQRQQLDSVERRGFIQEIQVVLTEAAYLVPLPAAPLVQAHAARVQGFEGGSRFGAAPLEYVWIGEAGAPEVIEIEGTGSVSIDEGFFSSPLSDAEWVLLGSVSHHLAGKVVLTFPKNDQRGYLFSTRPINTSSFKTAFDFDIWGGSGADGLALVVSRNIPTEADIAAIQEGKTQGPFGWETMDGFAIEFDTWGVNEGDPSDNHVGVNLMPYTPPGGAGHRPQTAKQRPLHGNGRVRRGARGGLPGQRQHRPGADARPRLHDPRLRTLRRVRRLCRGDGQ